MDIHPPYLIMANACGDALHTVLAQCSCTHATEYCSCIAASMYVLLDFTAVQLFCTSWGASLVSDVQQGQLRL